MELSGRRQALLERLHRRKTREREGLLLVEGVRAATDALDHDADVRFALRSPGLAGTEAGAALSARLDEEEVDVVDVHERVLGRAADTETPQGVLLVCGEPGWGLDALATGPVSAPSGRPRVLLLDAVQDPGNAGTLVRAAAAFGLSGVVALDGTVDPWGTKAVRASAGGIFRTRVVGASWDEAAEWIGAHGLPLLAADGAGEDVAEVAGSGLGGHGGAGWALAVGNEGAGVRSDLLARADRVVAIPMPGDAESLNVGVAGAILMYALAREASGRAGGDG